MNNTKQATAVKLGFLLCAVTAGALSGCYVEGPPHAQVYAPAPTVVVQDDYVYYPGYQVYYSNSRHQYRYQEGRSWVWRPTPPRVSAEVLLASPSVRLDFHDAPERHHATVVRQYPKHWAPAGPGHHDGEDHGKDHR